MFHLQPSFYLSNGLIMLKGDKLDELIQEFVVTDTGPHLAMQSRVEGLELDASGEMGSTEVIPTDHHEGQVFAQ